MELVRNDAPKLAPRLARELESPLVFLDVGVQGGIVPKWLALGGALRIIGIDPIQEAIDALAGEPGTYLALALGKEDGERDFYVTTNRYGSSFYPSGEGERRTVPVRSIDSLIRSGAIPPPDFIKIDCEGAEPEILAGASDFLASRALVGLESETSFGVSVIFPESHFSAINGPLVAQGLTVFDLAHDRVPRAARNGTSKLNTFNMLWCSDYAYDKNFAVPWKVIPPTRDQVLKLAIVFELYGLHDCAHRTLVSFSDVTGIPRRDADLLLD